MSVWRQVTESLGVPTAISTEPIPAGVEMVGAISSGEVEVMKNRFLAEESIVEAGQLIYAGTRQPGTEAIVEVTPVRARASRIVGVVTEVNTGPNGNMHRVKLNLPGIELPERRVLELNDIIDTVRELIRHHTDNMEPRDNIDHLGNRRVRVAGELMRDQVRIGLLRMHRMFQDRVGRLEKPEDAVPAKLVNVRPVTGAIREFFGGRQTVAIHGTRRIRWRN